MISSNLTSKSQEQHRTEYERQSEVPKQKQKTSKGKQAFLLAVGKFLALALTFVIPFFLARVLEKKEYGVYSEFYQAASFLISVFSISIPTSLYYFFPRVESAQRRTIVYNSLFILLLSACFASILICVPDDIGHIFLGNEIYPYRFWLAGYIILMMSSELMEPFYVSKCDTGISMWYPSFIILLKCGFVVLFTLIFMKFRDNPLHGTLLGIIATASIIFLFVQSYIYWKTRAFGGAFLSWSILTKQCVYILPFAIGNLLCTFARQFDKMIGMKFFRAEEYAAYAVAFFAIPGIAQIYSSVGNVYLVEMTKAFAVQDKKKALSLFHELCGKMLSITIPIVLVVALYAEEIITFIYTDKYLDSVPLFRFYIFAFIFTMMGTSLPIRASGKTIWTMLAYVFSAVFTLPLTYFAMKYYGVWGGVISAMISQLLPRFWQMLFEIRICETTFFGYLPWKKLSIICLISIGVLIPFLLLRYYCKTNIYVTILLIGFYLCGVMALELVNDLFIIDRSSVKKILNKIFS